MSNFIDDLENILNGYYDYSFESKLHQFTSYNADLIFQKEEIIYQFANQKINEQTMFQRVAELGGEDDDYIYDISLNYNEINMNHIIVLKHVPHQLMVYLLDDGEYKYLIKTHRECDDDEVSYKFESHTEAIEASNFNTIYNILPSMKTYTQAFNGVKDLFDVAIEKLNLESKLALSSHVNSKPSKKKI